MATTIKVCICICLALLRIVIGFEDTSPENAAVEATDDSFDSLLFPHPRSASPPTLIMYYAPWCGHCKRMKPIFLNASKILHVTGHGDHKIGDAALFVLVDATKQLRAAQRVGLTSFPSFFYTIRGKIYRYEGKRTLNDFFFFGRYLHIAWKLPNGFLDDVLQPGVLRTIVRDVSPRVTFVFSVPTQQSAKTNLSLIGHIADASASVGQSRFAFFVHRHSSKDGALEPPEENDADSVAWFTEVLRVVKECRNGSDGARDNGASCLGPQNEVLVAVSDCFEEPILYHGKWLSTRKSKPNVLHPSIRIWMNEYSNPCVEEVNSDTFPYLAARGYLAIGVVGTRPEPAKTAMIQALRQVARQRSIRSFMQTEALRVAGELDAYAAARSPPPAFDSRYVFDPSVNNDVDIIPPRNSKEEEPEIPLTFVFCYIDGNAFFEYLQQFGYRSPQTDFPTFFVLDALHEMVFQNDKFLGNVLKEISGRWSITAQIAIAEFVSMVENGTFSGEKYTTIGKISQFIKSFVPFALRLQLWLGGGDFELVAVSGALIVGTAAVWTAFRGGFGGGAEPPADPTST